MAFRYPVEEIRDRCDLVEIVSAHVALRKSGRRLLGLCPFHKEKTPSFHVDPERKVWKCFGCGEGGDVFSFVQKIDNLTFAEAAEQLAHKAGIAIDRSERAVREYSQKERLLRANSIACAFFRSALEHSQNARKYLARRGLTEASIEKYRLGYAPEGWDSLVNHLDRQRVSLADAAKAGLIIPREVSQGFYDRFRNRLMIPILDTSERVIAFGGRALGEDDVKYINSPESPLFAKNRALYGLNFARRAIGERGGLLVVEGYMDAITAQEAGFPNTVATMGTALTEEHVDVIARFTKSVILAFDADSAGMVAALRSGPLFERAGFDVRILSMPAGEDPDSLLRGGDTSRFAALLEQSLPIPDYRIKLVLSRHDLDTDEGKTAALKEAIGVVAEVESGVERERLIRALARYHPNFGTGTTLAEDHLRSEAARLRKTARRPQSAAVQAASAELAQRRLTLVERSERLLLGILLFREVDVREVFDCLPSNEFMGSETRTIAEVLSRQYDELGRIDKERLKEALAGTCAENLLTDLLIGVDEAELNHPVDELIGVIVTHRKNEQRRRMRDLARKIEEGAVKQGDEEYEEYYRLVRETSGPWRR